MKKPTPDELVARFEKRSAGKIAEEREVVRLSRLVLFNQQDLMQRTMALAADFTADQLGIPRDHVEYTIEIDHDNKRFVPTVRVTKPDGVDIDDAQKRYVEQIASVTEVFSNDSNALKAAAAAFPWPEGDASLEAFQDQLRRWM